ncbi:hypothetical protein AQI88_28855 [Streptomyces cellostaticus]|uniref:Uncharacterized protein n=1 Tax=Streptomyces cellostaticus TaxID=67285 RepID=A0A124HC31_9ACTN|nr:hypothetical protein [Streptomyces cellostaticus]KUM93128.1 hypothetical protein AQI88_28855 [Streptomyces cellostaticus]GHI06171.1 hypothetical protein Scel_44920 [Streptomyces cellostaticus]
MTDWAVTELGPHDRSAVTAAITLFEAVVGRGMLSVDQALQGVHDGTLLFLVARAGMQSAVVGAATACVLDDDSYGEFVAPMPVSALPTTPPSADGRRIGRLGTMPWPPRCADAASEAPSPHGARNGCDNDAPRRT